MRKYLFFLIIVSLAIGCKKQEYYQYLQKPVTENAFDSYQKALDHFRQTELDSSLVEVNEAIRIKKGYAPFYYLKGKIYLFQSKKDSAMINFEIALKLKSFYPEIWQDVSSIYFAEGNYEKALFYYEKLAGYLPQKEQYYFYIARCKNILGKYEVAALQLEELVQKGFYFDGLYYQLAYSFWKQKNIDRSVSYFNTYLKTHSNKSGKEELQIGIKIFEEDNNIEKILSIANLGLKLYPDYPDWRYYRISYYMQKANKSALKYELEKLKTIAVNDDKVKYFLAKWYTDNKRNEEGLAYYKNINEISMFSDNELITLVESTRDNNQKKKYLLLLFNRTSDKKYKKLLQKIEAGE